MEHKLKGCNNVAFSDSVSSVLVVDKQSEDNAAILHLKLRKKKCSMISWSLCVAVDVTVCSPMCSPMW